MIGAEDHGVSIFEIERHGWPAIVRDLTGGADHDIIDSGGGPKVGKACLHTFARPITVLPPEFVGALASVAQRPRLKGKFHHPHRIARVLPAARITLCI